MLILADALLQAPDRLLRPGHLRIFGKTVLETGRNLSPRAGEQVMELSGITLTPGFLNLHTHLELSPLHGKIPPSLAFAEWLRKLLPMLPGLNSTLRADAILSSARSAAETGTTTILNILSDPEALAGLGGTLPRIWWALEFMDLYGDPQPEKQMDRLAAWLSRNPACLWYAAISPHAPYSASPDLYRRTARLATELRIPFTTHLAESADEEELLRHGQGALRALLPESWTPDRPTDWMNAIPARSLIAHGNRFTDNELEDLSQRGCFVVHCPTSHAWFGRERFALEKFRRHQVPVVLGTDSPASSNNCALDLRAEARAFRQSHPEVTPAELWSMITTLPAQALGQEGRLGCLQPGSAADWVGWRLPPPTPPTPSPTPTDLISVILDSTTPPQLLSVAGQVHHLEPI